MINAHRAAVLLCLLAIAGHGALAGLVISSDNSDLCNSNMKDCSQRCPPPQNFVFMCSSGGTFSKPQSDCKCITPPPAGVVTDGSKLASGIDSQENLGLLGSTQQILQHSTSKLG